MRVAILGRTRWLLDSARALADAGHTIGFVATSKSASHDPAQPDDFATLAERFSAPFLRTNDLDAPASLQALRDSGCEVGLSINWNRILSRAITVFPSGILNVHAGDLPRYRGNAPVNWAILNGESHVGLCLHRMEPDVVDQGEVLARRHMAVTDQTYVGDVFGWLDRTIPELVVSGLGRLVTGDVPADEVGSTMPAEPLRCYPRRPEDSRIDWTKPAALVHRLIRASAEPFDGAFTTLEGRDVVRIWRADVMAGDDGFLAVPGQVMFRSDGYPVIACGAGSIILRRATLDGIDDPQAALDLIARSFRNRLV